MDPHLRRHQASSIDASAKWLESRELLEPAELLRTYDRLDEEGRKLLLDAARGIARERGLKPGRDTLPPGVN